MRYGKHELYVPLICTSNLKITWCENGDQKIMTNDNNWS